MISFGPVPSRRLGKSLGVNNITANKICSYSCVYCQVGLTHKFSAERQEFYSPDVIYKEVQAHLSKLTSDEQPDYLTFVANGEPTLDIRLGESISRLKEFQIPVAVITNASMLSDVQVRESLCLADWVSVKIDAGDELHWKKINRPFKQITFQNYLSGLKQFSTEFTGKLVTETMLVKDVNDKVEDLENTVKLVNMVMPSVAYISIPTRPPAVKTVLAADNEIINYAYQLFTENGLKTELILGFEGTDTGFTGNAAEDIINMCSVHPIREDTMQEILRKDNADNTLLDTLVFNNYILKLNYNSKNFYLRNFRR
ncbi:MAG: radical SAM protein [Bacteroidia bacterium]|nr:radical SAM protein [Bacteroidia bacterium]